MFKKLVKIITITNTFFFLRIQDILAFSGKLPIDPVTPNIQSLPEFIRSVLRIAIQIGIPISALFIIWSGFLFITAQGNESQLTKAKRSFVWAVVGAGVCLGAWLLATAIAGTIAQIGGN